MGNYQNLKFELKDGIVQLTINRPEKLNALNIQTMEEIDLAFREIYDNAEIKAVIVTGAGEKAFVAGADIPEIAALNDVNARKFAENGQEVFAAIENCHKPVIALVNGFALGGGCELAMACHIRVATANACFGQPEVNLGLIPGYGGTRRLTLLTGKAKSLELCMTGDLIKAAEAERLGLVNYVCESAEEAQTKSVELLRKIMSKESPNSRGSENYTACSKTSLTPDEPDQKTGWSNRLLWPKQHSGANAQLCTRACLYAGICRRRIWRGH